MNKNAFDQKLDEFFRNYQDSGMKKWSGFFLSDHTVKISKSNIERNTNYFKKSEMTVDKISEILLDSFCNHRLISLQLKDLDEMVIYHLILKALWKVITIKKQLLYQDQSCLWKQ